MCGLHYNKKRVRVIKKKLIIIIIITIIIIIVYLMQDCEKGEGFTFSHFPPPLEFCQQDGETKSLPQYSAFPLGTAP